MDKGSARYTSGQERNCSENAAIKISSERLIDWVDWARSTMGILFHNFTTLWK